ncbi:type I methionyl aminopeptidase [Buchnera aphidicola]|uniref:type I methionyl aminopeptidase n=1 Tax=Buchnera aphidicola TaxID=9 RepID=UPI0031B88BF2
MIKKKKEIKNIRLAGKIAAKTLEMIENYIKPNINTETINNICHNYIIKKKAIPACLGYKGFPKSICTSINEVVCHGIPNKKDILKKGDIINIDITVIKNGYHGDVSKMFILGEKNHLGKKLCKAAQKSLYLSLKKIKPGVKINIIGETIQNYINKKNFSIVKNYCGHGIGKNFHEEPQILHYKNKKKMILKKGMVFTIEPMINIGSCEVETMEDNWTVKTKDRKLSAQYEHTILVTKTGCEILTYQSNEKIKPILIN